MLESYTLRERTQNAKKTFLLRHKAQKINLDIGQILFVFQTLRILQG
jgi:hypothetical protein